MERLRLICVLENEVPACVNKPHEIAQLGERPKKLRLPERLIYCFIDLNCSRPDDEAKLLQIYGE